MGGIAALLALGLGFASRAFYVERDERIDKIEEALPGANCGACGYAGCSSFAEAVASGEAPADGCPVCNDDAAVRIAEIMGSAVSDSDCKYPQVLCNGGLKESRRTAEYQGIKSCKAADAVSGGTKSCHYGCLGLGDCVKACPFDAITIGENGLPLIDLEKCGGCGQCAEACPRNIIVMVSQTAENHILCSSHDPGKEARKICEVACIGCGLCGRVCPVDAITIEDNLAVIDYENCVNCGLCAEKCPTGAIRFSGSRIEEIKITDNCVGCTRCAKECPVGAIEGELKEKHEIDPEKCIKCGICYDVCKVKGAIEVKYHQEED